MSCRPLREASARALGRRGHRTVRRSGGFAERAEVRAAGRGTARRGAGFTLLETLVALVIFAAAAMALYGLFNTNLIALARAHDVSRQVPAVRQAVEYLSSINPREEGAGRVELAGTEVAWSSTLVEPVRQGQSASGGLGYFEIGLYELEFTVRSGERALGTWRMRALGYEQVREPSL